jgi:predicted O-methyltransferase YrrM
MYEFDNELDKPFIEEILINRPLSLMGDFKVKYITDIINKHNLNNILEVGTFAGGTTYLLAKQFPNKSITTVDLNNFEVYFTKFDHDKHLEMIQRWYPDITIQPNSIVKIQQLYKNNCENIILFEGNWHTTDISTFDAIFIDGDHSIDALTADLTYAYANMKKPGIIIVDDCVFSYIRLYTQEFCISNSLPFSFECHATYTQFNGDIIQGDDLCIITVNPT